MLGALASILALVASLFMYARARAIRDLLQEDRIFIEQALEVYDIFDCIHEAETITKDVKIETDIGADPRVENLTQLLITSRTRLQSFLNSIMNMKILDQKNPFFSAGEHYDHLGLSAFAVPCFEKALERAEKLEKQEQVEACRWRLLRLYRLEYKKNKVKEMAKAIRQDIDSGLLECTPEERVYLHPAVLSSVLCDGLCLYENGKFQIWDYCIGRRRRRQHYKTQAGRRP